MKKAALTVFTLAITAALLIMVKSLWKTLRASYLEIEAPQIAITENPQGVRIAPGNLGFTITDQGAGLQRVVIRLQQRGPTREIFKRTLSGERLFSHTIRLDNKVLELEEGSVKLLIKAFDKSFWANTSEQLITLPVDTRRPKVAAFTTMHNVREGGSQLLLYKAVDSHLQESGVQVGNLCFKGVPASTLQPTFKDNSLHAVVYAIPFGSVTKDTKLESLLYAVDTAGNSTTAKYPQRLATRSPRNVSVGLTNDFVSARKIGGFLTSEELSAETVSQALAAANDAYKKERAALTLELASQVRHERSFTEAFISPGGAVQTAFGDALRLTYEKNEIGRLGLLGYELRCSGDDASVKAASAGVVVIKQDLPWYGQVVGVDHGMGLVSLYGRMGSIAVGLGDTVAQGATLGTCGSSGFARIDGAQVYFELRVQGVPVDAREWWDKNWVQGHLTKKGADAEKAYQVYFSEIE